MNDKRYFLNMCPSRTLYIQQSHLKTLLGFIGLIIVLLIMSSCANVSIPTPSAFTAQSSVATSVPSDKPIPLSPTLIPTAVIQPTSKVTLQPEPKRSNGAGIIVFSATINDQEPSQIYTALEDGSSIRVLVKSEFSDRSPRISPDGKQVLFTRVSASTGHEKGALFIVNIDGSGLKPVDPDGCQQSCRAEQNGAWSPDGKRIAFSKAIVLSESYEDQGIWIINSDGSLARQISVPKPPQRYQDDFPAWSPDGSQVVFRRVDGMDYQSALLVVNVDGSGIKEIVSKKIDATEPSWSPDGTLIAFKAPVASLEGREPNIYIVHLDGSRIIPLTSYTSAGDNGGYSTGNAAWSPDGSKIIFSHSPSTDNWGDLFVVNRDGSDLKMLSATKINERQVDWGTGALP